jgi:hypothetical protein
MAVGESSTMVTIGGLLRGDDFGRAPRERDSPRGDDWGRELELLVFPSRPLFRGDDLGRAPPLLPPVGIGRGRGLGQGLGLGSSRVPDYRYIAPLRTT